VYERNQSGKGLWGREYAWSPKKSGGSWWDEAREETLAGERARAIKSYFSVNSRTALLKIPHVLSKKSAFCLITAGHGLHSKAEELSIENGAFRKPSSGQAGGILKSPSLRNSVDGEDCENWSVSKTMTSLYSCDCARVDGKLF